jgi:GNAT superfamily N-acetyltransferase
LRIELIASIFSSVEVVNPVTAERCVDTPGEGVVEQEPEATTLSLRNARPEDASAVAQILANAFPSLYRGTFGRLDLAAIQKLLQSLYSHGHLSLDDTRLCEVDGQVAGIMILHTGQPIGRGSAAAFWRMLARRYGLLRAPRLFTGGILSNLMLDSRIPRAADLVYIEALAVAELHRGKGIGTRLLADAEQWAREHGRSRLALHVLANNTGARRLYERIGFRLWDIPGSGKRWANSSSAPTWAALLLERRL